MDNNSAAPGPQAPVIDSLDPKIFAVLWKRLLAFTIDISLVFCIAFIFWLAIGFLAGYSGAAVDFESLSDWLYVFVFFGFYAAYNMVSLISFRTTLGKYLCAISVVDASASHPSKKQIIMRELLGKTVFFFILTLIWIILCLISRKKQAIHDVIASTYVVNSHLMPGHEKRKHLVPAAVISTILIICVIGIYIFNFVYEEEVWNEDIIAAVLTHMDNKNYGDAEAILDKALAGDPDNHEALVIKGLLYMDTNRADEAEEYLINALNADPPMALGHLIFSRLGLIYMSREDYSTAARLFDRSTNYPGADADTYYLLAVTKAGSGDSYNALIACEKALELNPEHAEAKKLILVLGDRM